MITKKDEYYFRLAAETATKSTYRNQKVMIGCIVVYKGAVISEGYNQDKTDPIQMKYNRFRGFTKFDESPHKIHAEITAIKRITSRDIEWNLVSVYVVRLMKDGTYGISRPCDACMHYIKSKGIRHLYYSTSDGFAYEKLTEKLVYRRSV